MKPEKSTQSTTTTPATGAATVASGVANATVLNNWDRHTLKTYKTTKKVKNLEPFVSGLNAAAQYLRMYKYINMSESEKIIKITNYNKF